MIIHPSVTPAALAVAGLLTFATIVSAQGTTSPVQPAPAAPEPLMPEPEALNLTPFVGVGFGGNLENTPASFGAALGYGLTPRLAVEGELSLAPGAEQGLLEEFDTSVWSLSANVLYHFTTPGADFTPYVAGGLGVLNGDAEAEALTPLVDDDTSTVFAWNFGAGLKTAMNSNWGLRADLRYFNGDDFAPDHWRMYGGVVIRRIGQ